MGDSWKQQVEEPTVAHKTYEELFKDVLPYYLSIGMTYEQFYYEDSELVVSYRKAQKLRDNSQNEFLWLQGLYFRDALAEVLNKCFGGSKSVKYPTNPYPLTKEDAERIDEMERVERMESLRQSLLNQNKRKEDDNHG